MLKYIFYLIIGAILLWVGGLGYFIYNLSQVTAASEEKTDGIVVLTGGKSRLQEAARLLQDGLGGKLFISGVNSMVTDEELRIVLGINKELAGCCIESGTEAKNTVGNAKEISEWVRKNEFTSIRVVTSLEHMPRTLVELKQYLADTRIIAHPVGQWKPENIRFLSLVREYSKYLVSLGRTRIAGL